MAKLTQKQENFCLAYIETGNASEAYRRSYNTSKMKPESINVKACELLKDVKVSVRVGELKVKAQERNEVTVDKLISELSKIAFVKESDFYHDDGSVKLLSELTDDQKAALASYRFKSIRTGEKDENGNSEMIDIPFFTSHDKIKAIDLLMKHLGGYEKDNGQKKQDINITTEIDPSKLSKDTMRELLESRNAD